MLKHNQNDLLNILGEYRRERRFVEGLTILGVVAPLIKITNGVLYLYG